MPGRVVAVALPERYEERLGDDVLRRTRAETAGGIPADAGRVPLEDQREPLGLGARSRDDLAIGWVIVGLSGFGDRQARMFHAAILSAGA